MKKIILGIIIIIAIFIAIIFMNNDKKFKGIATVTDVISFSSINVEIKDNDKIIGNAIINSNVFNIGDKLEVEGIKKDELIINKIKYLGTTEEEKNSIISNCEENPKLYDYKSKINIIGRYNNDDGISFIKIYNLPIKLNNQYYDLNISPLEYFEIEYQDTIYEYMLISNYDIVFTSDDKFIVKEVVANYEDKKEFLEYKFEDNTLTFGAVDNAVYSVTIEYENGDIISYIFS